MGFATAASGAGGGPAAANADSALVSVEAADEAVQAKMALLQAVAPGSRPTRVLPPQPGIEVAMEAKLTAGKRT